MQWCGSCVVGLEMLVGLELAVQCEQHVEGLNEILVHWDWGVA